MGGGRRTPRKYDMLYPDRVNLQLAVAQTAWLWPQRPDLDSLEGFRMAVLQDASVTAWALCVHLDLGYR